MTLQPASALLRTLIMASERAANIARLCRANPVLFCVEAKADVTVHGIQYTDAKTLADVVIQEALRRDIVSAFPSLESRIHGEEEPYFRTADAHVHITLTNSKSDTLALLQRVLGASVEARAAAELLAAAIHTECAAGPELPDVDAVIDLASIAMWIDPIDATAAYVHGQPVCPTPDAPILATDSLFLVATLMGVYDTSTGLPIIGVINQPFYVLGESGWTGRYVWGVSHGGVNVYGPTTRPHAARNVPVVVHSKRERPDIIARLQQFTSVGVPGAGYKQLCVIDGLADAFVLSAPSTYKWDTCAGHAILRAQGRELRAYDGDHELLYDDLGQLSNKNGVFVARTPELATLLRAKLSL